MEVTVRKSFFKVQRPYFDVQKTRDRTSVDKQRLMPRLRTTVSFGINSVQHRNTNQTHRYENCTSRFLLIQQKEKGILVTEILKKRYQVHK